MSLASILQQPTYRAVQVTLTGEGGTFTLTRGTAPPLTGLTPAQVLTHFGAA